MHFLYVFVFFRLCCFYANTLGHCILRENMHVGTSMHIKALTLWTLLFLLFLHVFFCTFGMQKLKKFVEMQARRQKWPPEAVLELFWLTFGLLGGHFCPPLGVLRRYWAALGPPSGVKNRKIAPGQNSLLAPGAPGRLGRSKKTSSGTIF